MKKFGTFQGVFVPSYEAILGAVLFLILPGLTGASGLWQILMIIIISKTVTIATSFSIADCTTNLENIGAGGMYAVAKRSLGRAFGGSIGIQLFLAQAASIGFYVLGFASPLQEILYNIPAIQTFIDSMGWSTLQQQQIIASAIAFLAFLSAIAGADFIVNLQMVIFVVMSVSIGSIIISPLLGITKEGANVFSSSPTLGSNITEMIKIGGFWVALTTFFPAVTGIDAGVGMSGVLKDTRKSLAVGTFLSIAITFVIYLAVAFVLSYINPELLRLTSENGQLQYPSLIQIFSSSQVVYWLLVAGILFATGSSALSYFMTAPRTAQALAKEEIFPKFLSFMGKDFTKNGVEPRMATLVTFLIVLAVVWSGSVAFASMIVGICFLVVYGWVNLAAFLERISGNPSFRPTSKGHWSISLYGFLICMFIITITSPLVGVLVILSQFLIFALLLKFKTQNQMEGVWWGVLFSILNWGFKRMRRIIQGTKNWRPIVGIFCMADKEEEAMTTLEIGRRLANYQGLVMTNILKPEKLGEIVYEIPENAHIVEPLDSDLNSAIVSILQGAVPGGFKINTALLPIDSRINNINIIEDIINMDKNVLLYKHGIIRDYNSNRIDVWWKGEENGNLMALLSYIMDLNDKKERRPGKKIRLIRKLFDGENREKAYGEMEQLLYSARLKGEILIIDEDNKPIQKTIQETSSDATLIMMGMPGKKGGGIARFFSLDKLFFTRELDKFKDLPPLLFVKAYRVMELFE